MYHASTAFKILVRGSTSTPLGERVRNHAREIGAESDGHLCCDFVSTCFLQRNLSHTSATIKKDMLRFDSTLLNDYDVPGDDAWMQPLSMFRDIVVKCVLATDMKNHFDLVSTFNAHVTSGYLMKSVGCFTDIDKRHFMYQIAMKVADLGQITRPLNVTFEWTRRVNEVWEFWRQILMRSGIHVSRRSRICIWITTESFHG